MENNRVKTKIYVNSFFKYSVIATCFTLYFTTVRFKLNHQVLLTWNIYNQYIHTNPCVELLVKMLLKHFMWAHQTCGWGLDGSGRELRRRFETRVSLVLVLFSLWSVPVLSGAQQVLRAPRDPPTFPQSWLWTPLISMWEVSGETRG